MSPGQTGSVPGTKWVCPRDKPRFSSYFTQQKPSLSLGQTQFVPGTFRGRRAADRVYVSKVYVPFSFPNCWMPLAHSYQAEQHRVAQLQLHRIGYALCSMMRELL